MVGNACCAHMPPSAVGPVGPATVGAQGVGACGRGACGLCAEAVGSTHRHTLDRICYTFLLASSPRHVPLRAHCRCAPRGPASSVQGLKNPRGGALARRRRQGGALFLLLLMTSDDQKLCSLVCDKGVVRSRGGQRHPHPFAVHPHATPCHTARRHRPLHRHGTPPPMTLRSATSD